MNDNNNNNNDDIRISIGIEKCDESLIDYEIDAELKSSNGDDESINGE